MTVNARTITDEEFFYGHKACPGCGGALAVRQALKVLGPHAVAALPAGCMSATGFNFPQLAFGNNAMITPFAATAAVLSGIEAGLRAQGGGARGRHRGGFSPATAARRTSACRRSPAPSTATTTCSTSATTTRPT